MTEPVEWRNDFLSNYAVLKGLSPASVPANLRGVYQRLLAGAQDIQYLLDNHLYLSAQGSDAVDQWFALAHAFAQRMGSVHLADPGTITPPDTTPISDPIAHGENFLANRVPQDLAEWEAEMERLLMWGVVLAGAVFLGPPLIRAIRGERR